MNTPRSVTKLCRALSVETRVRLALMLKERTLCVGALAARLGVTQGAVSQHLRVLRQAGLVGAERRGRYVHYHLRPDALTQWRRAAEGLLAHGGEVKRSRKESTHV